MEFAASRAEKTEGESTIAALLLPYVEGGWKSMVLLGIREGRS